MLSSMQQQTDVHRSDLSMIRFSLLLKSVLSINGFTDCCYVNEVSVERRFRIVTQSNDLFLCIVITCGKVAYLVDTIHV